MLKHMPFEIINYYDNMTNIKLDNFFGFALCKIKVDESINKPLLPYKSHNLNKTIYPTGEWIGTYFSEELKAVSKFEGYKIELIKGYEFNKIDLFSEYVNHFFNIKMNATGPERFIAKMHLNQLYGIFGRKLDQIETINIYKKDLYKYLSSRIVKNIIEINSEIVCLLIYLHE
jgi:hypothetical protein